MLQNRAIRTPLSSRRNDPFSARAYPVNRCLLRTRNPRALPPTHNTKRCRKNGVAVFVADTVLQDKDESMSRESRVERPKKWRKAAAQPALPHACRLAGHQKTSLGPFLSGAEQPLSPISCANPNATEKSGTCRPNRTTYPSCTQHPCLTQRNICRVRIGAVTPAALQSLSRRSQLRSMRIAPCED